MKKTLLSLAFIALVPFGAWADWTANGFTYHPVETPAVVPYGGTIVMTGVGGAYQTVTIDDDDDEHIASTAYVKGAYNDVIAAVNTNALYTWGGEPVNSGVLADPGDFIDIIDEGETSNYYETLASLHAVAGAIDYKLNHQPVKIYTSWDDDTAATSVTLSQINQ